ncbi:XRE family transcriptional regulator [Xylophilus sp.]|uniref:XRE family transcriptional regulator n=1 Tax=Xylophilus sp. TaxID=2653893 RepID=UPI0013B6D666|nr:LexA family transcriptional regulator [Xylophilus sp.]KAF1047907.1 MAG: putative HTH-type transcriptional regulator [Xylophilus sp.]
MTSSDGDFRQRLLQICQAAGSASQLARRAGISASGLSRYLAGGEPTRTVLVRLAQAADVRVEWLASGTGPMHGSAAEEPLVAGTLTLLPLIDATAPPAAAPTADLTTHAFCRIWLANRGLDDKHLAASRVDGDSMAPALEDGDVVLIDTSARAISDGKIHAIRDTGRIMLRRLRLELDGSVRISPDNCAHREFVRPVDSLNVLGRLVWRGTLL